jgi:hypothetical protein
MAYGVGYFWGAQLLAKLNGATNFTPPATWYAALMTASPTDAGGGTELTGGSYGRVSKTNNTTNFPAPSGTATQTLGTDIDWGSLGTISSSTIVAVAFYDAASAGNLGLWVDLSTPKAVASGDSFKVFAANGTFTAR